LYQCLISYIDILPDARKAGRSKDSSVDKEFVTDKTAGTTSQKRGRVPRKDGFTGSQRRIVNHQHRTGVVSGFRLRSPMKAKS
jgi:hypothetical protein